MYFCANYGLEFICARVDIFLEDKDGNTERVGFWDKF